jgi:uncharacterized phage protein (TIGR01671 family)
MSREHKFRGKRIDTGEWVYGSLMHGNTSCMIITMVNTINGMVLFDLKYETVDPETVGEYTGLKDKNGGNGFESDIIKERNSIGVITFVDGSFIIDWVINKDFWSDTLKFHLPSAKIIGNKFDNPDLLNAGGKVGK